MVYIEPWVDEESGIVDKVPYIAPIVRVYRIPWKRQKAFWWITQEFFRVACIIAICGNLFKLCHEWLTRGRLLAHYLSEKEDSYLNANTFLYLFTNFKAGISFWTTTQDNAAGILCICVGSRLKKGPNFTHDRLSTSPATRDPIHVGVHRYNWRDL